jgi:hypothetical protein
MLQVITTDSSTPCYTKNPDPEREPQAGRRTALRLMVAALCAPAWPVAAQLAPESATQVQWLVDDDSLLVSADLPWTLPQVVLQALLQGIPVHFVAEVDVVRPRWYWRNQTLMQARRYLRLSYQPLTRRWRLYMGNVPFEGQGLGVALAQTYENLQEALQAMQRMVRWRIGSTAQLPREGSAWLDLRFRIDLSHFPRPLQIGVLGRADWNMLVTQKVMLDLGTLP